MTTRTQCLLNDGTPTSSRTRQVETTLDTKSGLEQEWSQETNGSIPSVFSTFKELTKKGKKIKEGIRKEVANALILYQTNENSRSGAPLLGIGADHVENPAYQNNRPVKRRRGRSPMMIINIKKCCFYPNNICVVWCGVVWCGVVWCSVVWCGVVWCGVVWYSVMYV